MVQIGDVFEEMNKHFNPGAATNLDASFQFNISGPAGGIWAFKIKNGTFQLVKG